MEIGEEHLIELGSTGHLPQRAYLDAGAVHVHEERRDALVLGHVGVGSTQQFPDIGAVRDGSPYLLPVHYPTRVNRLRTGSQPGKVGSRSWLAEQLAGDEFAAVERP